MAKIEGTCREVVEKSEWVALATSGPDGPHLAATWGDYVRALGFDGDTLVIPAGHYGQTEANLQQNPRIEVLFASRQVQGTYGPGQGCKVCGTAVVETSGARFDQAKAQFPWARGVLVITIESAETQL